MENYNITTDVKYDPLQLIDVKAIADACPDKWWNNTLCQVNDCVVRLGVIEGEFHWHTHDEEDEYFYVVEGELLIDVGDDIHSLSPGQSFLVPRGVEHRTRAPRRTVILMVERASVVPTGD